MASLWQLCDYLLTLSLFAALAGCGSLRSILE